MFCPQCGTQFEGRFCPNCGTQVPNAAPAGNSGNVNTGAAQPAASGVAVNFKNAFGDTLFLVMMICAGVAAFCCCIGANLYLGVPMAFVFVGCLLCYINSKKDGAFNPIGFRFMAGGFKSLSITAVIAAGIYLLFGIIMMFRHNYMVLGSMILFIDAFTGNIYWGMAGTVLCAMFYGIVGVAFTMVIHKKLREYIVSMSDSATSGNASFKNVKDVKSYLLLIAGAMGFFTLLFFIVGLAYRYFGVPYNLVYFTVTGFLGRAGVTGLAVVGWLWMKKYFAD